MKYVLKSFAVFAFAFSSPLIAAESAPAVAELEPLEIQASAFGGRTPDDVVQPVQVLIGDELERKRAGTIGETLSQEPGIANSSFGAGAGRPVIRGLSGSRVQVLENGLPAMDASDVSADHAVAIDPSHAQQIEIIRGPATLLFGNGAIGGVVNLVTDRLGGEPASGVRLFADSRYGDNADETSSHAGLEYSGEAWSFHLDGAYRDQKDYEQGGGLGVLANSKLDVRNGSLGFGYSGRDSRYAANLSLFETTYGLPNEAEAFIELEQARADVIGQLDAPFAGIQSLRVRAGVNDYTHREFEDPATLGTTFENEELQLRLEAEHAPFAGLHGALGLQLGHRDFSADGAEAFLPFTKTKNVAMFMVEQKPMDFGRLEFGARVEHQRIDVDAATSKLPATPESVSQTPLSLAAGALVDLGDGHHLRFNAVRAQRAPAVEEQYSFGPHIATGNFERSPNRLQKETANNLELGVDRHQGRWTWSASVYVNEIRDFAYLQSVDCNVDADDSSSCTPDGTADLTDEDGVFDAVNGEFTLREYRQADARFYGAEAETAYALLEGPMKVSVHLFGDVVRGELKSGGHLPRITPVRAGLGLEGEYAELSAGVHLTGVERQDRTGDLENPTGSYTLLSADLGYTLRANALAVTFYLRGRNLLDEEVREHTSFLKDDVAAPGRSLFGGVHVEFGS